VNICGKMNLLERLKEECVRCRKCGIGGVDVHGSDGVGHLSNVFSTMNLGAKVMIVGQNPGWEEICQMIPFVGPSGKMLMRCLEELVGLKREDVYITNVCKCYTDSNRKPTDEETENCRTFLEREFELVHPKIAVALGSVAFRELTGMSGIMKHCGSIQFSIRYNVPVLVMLHPSPLNTNMPEKRVMFENSILKLKEFLEKET